jgi:HlyD family secretion protein
VLLTVADMSVIEAEVEVDETDIPTVRLGQVAKVTVDAIPEKTFTGKVTEIGNSPIQAAGQPGASSAQATNFKVVVTLDGEIPEVRPGFTCTAEITTATRQTALSVPIQALAVRELTRDPKGQIVREKKETERGRSAMPTASAQELPPGHTRKEEEGVFIVRDNRAEFVPVKTGIAGDKYFELLPGSLKESDQVITGPFASVRNLRDGDSVKIQPTEPPRR